MAQAVTKPHQSYQDLAALLQSRGMELDDPAWVERKLAQRLRLVLLDAIERIEVHVRSVIAHELSNLDPFAYQNSAYIDPKFLSGAQFGRGARPVGPTFWDEWREKHDKALTRSREDCIEWHKKQQKPIPFWVAIEAWDFGILSKYYSLLKGKLKGRIAGRLGIKDYTVFEGWLRELNNMRNRCAHHSRVWNQTYSQFRDLPGEAYFQDLQLSQNARTRVYGYIAVLWFLLQRIGPNSNWLDQVADLIDMLPELPGCSHTSLGLDPDMVKFPRALLHSAGKQMAASIA